MVEPAAEAGESRTRAADAEDPILALGQNPARDGVRDGSTNHDRYLHGQVGGDDGGTRSAAGERSLEGFVSVLRRHLPEIKERFGVESVGVFGSYARGQGEEGSDLDVLVGFRKTPDLFVFMDLEEYLGELLGVEVELVSRDSLGGNVEKRVLSEVVPV
ncbi:MAG: nucleotidyltransferase family protein [Actinomycetota bacterium]